MTWGQVNRQRLLPCHNLWDLEEQKGFFEFIIQREGEKPQTRGTFMGRHKKLPKELTTELLYLELPTISASCGVKRYMYYIRLFLTNQNS